MWVIIIITEIEKLNTQIGLEGHYVEFTVGCRSVRVGLKLINILNKIIGNESKDENFITVSSDVSEADESDEQGKKNHGSTCDQM